MSTTSQPIKTINIRIDERLWEACKKIADERHQSFNKFAEDALLSAAKEQRRLGLKAAFEQLAIQGQDVEFGFGAQSEVVLGRNIPSSS